MNRLKLASLALSISCGVGVLMAIIVTGNKTSLPRTAVVIPTENPVKLNLDKRDRLTAQNQKSYKVERLPDNIDRIITSSIARKTNRSEKRNEIIARQKIDDIIAGDKKLENPYPFEDETVRVQTGDTLFSISRRTGVNVYKLASINSIKEPYVIRPGQILRLIASK